MCSKDSGPARISCNLQTQKTKARPSKKASSPISQVRDINPHVLRQPSTNNKQRKKQVLFALGEVVSPSLIKFVPRTCKFECHKSQLYLPGSKNSSRRGVEHPQLDLLPILTWVFLFSISTTLSKKK